MKLLALILRCILFLFGERKKDVVTHVRVHARWGIRHPFRGFLNPNCYSAPVVLLALSEPLARPSLICMMLSRSGSLIAELSASATRHTYTLKIAVYATTTVGSQRRTICSSSSTKNSITSRVEDKTVSLKGFRLLARSALMRKETHCQL